LKVSPKYFLHYGRKLCAVFGLTNSWNKIFSLSSQVQPKRNELCINETDDFYKQLKPANFISLILENGFELSDLKFIKKVLKVKNLPDFFTLWSQILLVPLKLTNSWNRILFLSSQVQPKRNELSINPADLFTNNGNQRILQIFAATLDLVPSSCGSYLKAVLIYRWLE